MITYEYECGCCGNVLEVQQSIKDDPLKECPKCKVCALQRLISKNTTFVLKGDGWAKDLYSSPKR